MLGEHCTRQLCECARARAHERAEPQHLSCSAAGVSEKPDLPAVCSQPPQRSAAEGEGRPAARLQGSSLEACATDLFQVLVKPADSQAPRQDLLNHTCFKNDRVPKCYYPLECFHFGDRGGVGRGQSVKATREESLVGFRRSGETFRRSVFESLLNRCTYRMVSVCSMRGWI